MQKLSSNQKTWLWLNIFLLLFVVIGYFAMSEKPEEYPKYDSNSPSPTGVKAIYTYLENQKRSIDRWAYSPELLSKQGENQLLIMVEPLFIPGKKEMDEYKAFMEKGNTILLLKTNPDGMLGLETAPTGKGLSDHYPILDNAGNQYRAEIQSPVRIQTKDNDEVLLHDRAGTIAMKRSHGNGELVVATAPNWITNDKLLEKDHLVLVLSLLREAGEDGDTILFDEYIHGAAHAPTLFTVYPKWLLVLGMQAILFATIWLWYQGKRFGPVFVSREETVRFSDERIKALAAWYQRGRKYHDSLAIQADYVKFLLQERWSIPYHKNWTDIDGHLERTWKNQSNDEIRSFLNGITSVLRKQQVSKQEYLQWSKKIDRLRKEVEEG